MMPEEIAINSKFVNHMDNTEMNNEDYSVVQDCDISLNVPAATNGEYQPLPLQRIAAIALSDATNGGLDNVKEPPVQEDEGRKDSISEATPVNDEKVIIPYGTFTNAHKVKIIGGIECCYSGEKHAQIVHLNMKGASDDNNHLATSISKRLECAFNRGLCITKINGESVRDFTFENVQKIIRSAESDLEILVRDCRILPRHCPNTKCGSSKEPVKQPTHFLKLRKQRRSTSEAEATPTSHAKNEGPLEVSIECGLEPENNLMPPKALKTHNTYSSSHSLSSTASETPQTKIDHPLEETNKMIKLSFRYIKPILHINLHKVKMSSTKAAISSNSNLVLNATILPDKGHQGIQCCGMISKYNKTEEILDQSACYTLSPDELEKTSVRVSLWDGSKPKRPHFEGEVFLKLTNNGIVNTEGVPRWYGISTILDRNLPPLPPPLIVNAQGTLIKKVKMSWTAGIGNRTINRIKKSEKKRRGGIVQSSSLQDIPKTPEQKLKAMERLAVLPAMLQPLKDDGTKLRNKQMKRNSRSNNRLSAYEINQAEFNKPVMTRVPSDPNLVQRDTSPSSRRNMSIFEFLNALNSGNLDTPSPRHFRKTYDKPNHLQVPGTPDIPTIPPVTHSRTSSVVTDSDNSQFDDLNKSKGISLSSLVDIINRPGSVAGSEMSYATTISSTSDGDSSTVSSLRHSKHIHGWSEESALDKTHGSESFPLVKHSLVVDHHKLSLQHVEQSPHSTERSIKDSASPLLKINDKIYSSMETLDDEGIGRSGTTVVRRDKTSSASLASQLRLSKSTGCLVDGNDEVDDGNGQSQSFLGDKEKNATPQMTRLSPFKAHSPNKRKKSLQLFSDESTNVGKIFPALVSHRKDSHHGTVMKLLRAYDTGKVIGSANMQLVAKFVSGIITLQINDIVFFNNKLMNTDYVVKVNLYNRFNEECEVTQKTFASIKKDGLQESKLLPPQFDFTGNPSVYYLQVLFQLRNRVFGHKLFHIFLDVKDATSLTNATETSSSISSTDTTTDITTDTTTTSTPSNHQWFQIKKLNLS